MFFDLVHAGGVLQERYYPPAGKSNGVKIARARIAALGEKKTKIKPVEAAAQ